MENLRINLGCGKKFVKGAINIDVTNHGQDLILDLEKDKLPYKDNSAEYVRADHFLEHLRDCKNVLNEAWRVLKADGTFEIYVPLGKPAYNPVHLQRITAYWFKWLRGDDREYYYGYKRWNILNMTSAVNSEGEEYELHCILQPYK